MQLNVSNDDSVGNRQCSEITFHSLDFSYKSFVQPNGHNIAVFEFIYNYVSLAIPIPNFPILGDWKIPIINRSQYYHFIPFFGVSEIIGSSSGVLRRQRRRRLCFCKTIAIFPHQ